jgi:hypothetical protein
VPIQPPEWHPSARLQYGYSFINGVTLHAKLGDRLLIPYPKFKNRVNVVQRLDVPQYGRFTAFQKTFESSGELSVWQCTSAVAEAVGRRPNRKASAASWCASRRNSTAYQCKVL